MMLQKEEKSKMEQKLAKMRMGDDIAIESLSTAEADLARSSGDMAFTKRRGLKEQLEDMSDDEGEKKIDEPRHKLANVDQPRATSSCEGPRDDEERHVDRRDDRSPRRDDYDRRDKRDDNERRDDYDRRDRRDDYDRRDNRDDYDRRDDRDARSSKE